MSRIRLDWIGLTLIVWSVLTRASLLAEPLPGWDADPTQLSITIIGLGPTGSLGLDVAAWLGAGLVFLSCRKRRASTDPLVVVAFVGAAAILTRTLLVDAGDVEAIRVGSSWASGWIGFAAILTQASKPMVRTVLGSVLVSFILFLVTKACVQVFIEHPHMLAMFKADPAQSLMAQGIEPGTSQAMIYERRLNQPDPTAWFGLSNVLASFFAGGLVLLTFTGLQMRNTPRFLAWFGAMLIGAALLLTGSKAGLAVAGIGFGVGAATLFVRGTLAKSLCLAGLLVPPLAVILRGTLLAPTGELSLLVRWFYMRGATRITAESLPSGTGPTGFQDAYMRAKPSLGTEDVISPHIIWLDYSATLGLFAIPVLAALAWIMWRLVRHTSDQTGNFHAVSQRRLKQAKPMILLWMILPVLAGAWLEAAATPIESAVARLVGVSMWAGMSLLLIRSGHPTRRVLALLGVVLFCHAQLDMNMTLSGSTPLVLALLALACPMPTGRKLKFLRPVLTVGALLATVCIVWTSFFVWLWESDLRRSSQRLSEIVEDRDVMLTQQASPADFVLLQQRFAEACAESMAELEAAQLKMPGDIRVAAAAAQLGMALAATANELADRPQAIMAAQRAEEVLTQALLIKERASLHGQRAGILNAQTRLLELGPVADSDIHELRLKAIAAWEMATQLAPYNHRYPTSLALAYSELGDLAQARLWALEALSRDDLTALDPLSSMSESARRRLERLAESP